MAKANVRQDDFPTLDMAATKQATVTEGGETVMVVPIPSERVLFRSPLII